LSPTRLWINNPTPEEARKAIAAGAISCTTNPTYSFKQITNEETREEALKIVKDAIEQTDDNNEAADLVQQQLAKRILIFSCRSMKNDLERKVSSLFRGTPLPTKTRSISSMRPYGIAD
jgi:hypothetical protein